MSGPDARARPAFADPARDATCRGCGAAGLQTIADLGRLPLAHGLCRTFEESLAAERFPLTLGFCEACALVQLLEIPSPRQIFGGGFSYLSSVSLELASHARERAVALVSELGLGPGDLVVEPGSNDGYLLVHFLKAGVSVLGVEPAPIAARRARQRGVETRELFFGETVAEALVAEGLRARLVVANNVAAHVPDPNDFVRGLALVVRDDGRVLVDVAYVRDLVERGHYDTVFHEHVFYYSLTSAAALFARNGLALLDAERVPFQGGSLRLAFARSGAPSSRAAALLAEERAMGLDRVDAYRTFADRMKAHGAGLADRLLGLVRRGNRLALYGAPAKGTTLLNLLGLDYRHFAFAVDRNPEKQGLFIPGAGIEISRPARLVEERPDQVLMLPWNLRSEILTQEARYLAAGGKFIVPFPELETVP